MRSIWRSRTSLPKKKKENEELVEVNNELQTITARCSTLEDTIKRLDAPFVEMMKKAEEKNMMHFVIEGNALRRKSEEKVQQLFDETGLRAPNQEEKVRLMEDFQTYTMHLFVSIWKCFSNFVLMYNVFYEGK